MKRIMMIATGMALAIFLSLTMSLLTVSLAQAQQEPTTGVTAAGVYVEDVGQGQEPGVQGRVLILYADGNLTLHDPTAISPMYGICEEAGGTSTDTDTDTDTSTDTGTETGAVTLDCALFDPNTGERTSYTIEIDEAGTSLTLTNGDPEATFTRFTIDTEPEPPTTTETTTQTNTETTTQTGTSTSTATQ